MLLACLLLAVLVQLAGLIVTGGPCSCCNPYYAYVYYSYYAAFAGGGATPTVSVCCCEGRLIPTVLHVTINVISAAGCTFGINGVTFPIVWDGIDSWYGEIDTVGCTSCKKFFARLQCIVDSPCVWLFTMSFFGDAPNPSPPPATLPCFNPTPPPIPACTGSAIPFDCDALTAQITNKYTVVDQNFSPFCCEATPGEQCFTIIGTLTI
jgi:hypothetical protein